MARRSSSVSHNDAVGSTPTTTVIEVDGFESLEVLQGELRQEGEEVVHGEEWRLGGWSGYTQGSSAVGDSPYMHFLETPQKSTTKFI
jgi:hypothetical protein